MKVLVRGGGQSKTLKERINSASSGDVINLGKEDLEIKDSDSYTIDKPITICDGNLKNATFVVKSDRVVFENLRNVESVLADEEIRDGDFEISNCYEVQSLYVRGGGANSIHIAATTIKNLQVAKENVRIVLKADDGKAAKVESAVISTNCTLDSEIENTEDSTADFGEILIDKSVEKITLKGNTSVDQIIAEVKNETTNETATIHVESSDVKLEVVATEKGTVVEEEKITVSEGVTKPTTVALNWKVYDYQKEQTGTENVELENSGSEAVGTVSSALDANWKHSMMFSRRFNSSTAYIISFWAKADTERTQTLCIRNYDDELELLSPTIDLTTEYKKYTYQFYLTSEDLNEEIEFQFRLNQGDTYIKDCYITPMWIEKNGVWEKKADFPQWSIWSDSSCRTYPANWIVLQDMSEDSIKVQRSIERREESFNNWKLQFGYEKEIKQAGKYVFSFTDDKNLTGCINLRNGTTNKDISSYSDLTGSGDYYIIFNVPETEVNNMFGLHFWTKDMELTDGIEYIQLSNVKLEKYDSNKTYSGKNLGQKQSLIYFESERGKLENWDSMYMYVDIGSQIETFPTLIYEGTDYTFAGWYTDSEFNNLMTFPYTVTENNLTVYAKWIDNLELFANGDIVGDFSVVQDENGDLVYSDYAGIPFTSEGDGVYSATFIYDSSYMIGWGSPSGTCAFKARTVANSWGGTSYGIADSANQHIIGGDAVLIDSVQGNNIVVTGFVDGTAYKITFICAQDGTVSLKVEETETYTMTISALPVTQGSGNVPKGYIVDLSSVGEGTDYVILGWFTDENFTEPVEFPYTVNSDVTFYAKITSFQVCKVIFRGVDTAIYPDLTFNYGDIINEDDLPVMTVEGYTFDGWYLDYEKTQKLTYPYTITNDIGLYPGLTQN